MITGWALSPIGTGLGEDDRMTRATGRQQDGPRRQPHRQPHRQPSAVRTLLRIAYLSILANIAGAIVVALLITAVNSRTTSHQRAVLIVTGVVVVVVSLGAGTVAGLLAQRRTLRWLLLRRPPSAADARRALRAPLDLAAVCAVTWSLGAIVIVIVALAVGVDGPSVAGMGCGVLLAGLCTAGVTYLIVAYQARPVVRRVLAVHPPMTTPLVSVSARLLFVWALTTGVPLLGIVLILLEPGGHAHVVPASMATAIVALVVGSFGTWLASRAIGQPLRALTFSLRRIGQGDLSTAVEVEDAGEIGLVQRGVNEMVLGLQERERIADLFGRHVGPAVAAQALTSGATLSGEARTVVALFVDITGSTAMTHRSDPVEFVGVLNRFFTIVVDAVEAEGGLVNKFEGDGALCIFGAPVTLDDAATAALRAARAIRAGVLASGEVSIGIGVAVGRVVAGQVGTPSRLEYTVIGDAVNEASRLTDVAKGTSNGVLATEAVVLAASEPERECWTPDGAVVLRGRDAETRTWTLIGAAVRAGGDR